MMYFLDFDRTCFDTDSFIEYLATKPHTKQHTGVSELELASALDADAKSGSLSFAPGELSVFLYQDAAQFLRDKENSVMLITYGNPSLQKAKIESALYGIPRISTIYTGEVRKGDFIAPYMGMYGKEPVFVDDTPLELEILETKAPNTKLYEIRRNGAAGDGRWQVITSLSEVL